MKSEANGDLKLPRLVPMFAAFCFKVISFKITRIFHLLVASSGELETLVAGEIDVRFSATAYTREVVDLAVIVLERIMAKTKVESTRDRTRDIFGQC